MVIKLVNSYKMFRRVPDIIIDRNKFSLSPAADKELD